jgi:hypothetical protein
LAPQRWGLFKQALRVPHEIASVILEHGDDVFALFQHVVEHPGIGVQGIGDHHVKRAGVSLQNAIQQPQGRGHLILTGTLRFGVQQDVEVAADQLKGHVTVIYSCA